MSDEGLKRTKNDNLGAAKKAKFDEFYTQYHDIEKEMNAYLDYDKNVFRDKTILLPCDDPEWSNFTKYFAQNFERLGLKKLISTSYAPDSKPEELNLQLSLFETQSPKFDRAKARANGKIYTLTRDTTGDKKINVEDLEWEYLRGDGDFRSAEVTVLRDEADIIITNPPFSLFREFLDWITSANKKLVIIGNMNAITYKETFRLIKDNKLWVGATGFNEGMYFRVPDNFMYAPTYKFDRERDGIKVNRVPGVCWYTNIDHGRRHEPLPLMTEADNTKFSKHKEIKGKGYQTYDNYDAVEVPFTDAIPSDYPGIMGVPISFLVKYNPDQFEILGMCENEDLYQLKTKQYTSAECKAAYLAKFKKPGTYDLNASGVLIQDGQYEKVYQRIIIKHRKAS
jgi:hypothetical protein